MGRRGTQAPRSAAAALVAAVAVLVAGCGGTGGSGGSAAGTDAGSATTAPTSTTAAGSAGPTSTTAATTTTAPGASGLEDATVAQHSAPVQGSGTALLEDVRVGRHDTYERIVFQFRGNVVPGYTMQWVDGPILADASGEPVKVAGAAHLEMVFTPASGVDLSAPDVRVVYDGPDRVPVAGTTELITDLVRTGDFEAVLTWVAGATGQVPFRVTTLDAPVRVVVDLATG